MKADGLLFFTIKRELFALHRAELEELRRSA